EPADWIYSPPGRTIRWLDNAPGPPSPRNGPTGPGHRAAPPAAAPPPVNEIASTLPPRGGGQKRPCPTADSAMAAFPLLSSGSPSTTLPGREVRAKLPPTVPSRILRAES